MDAVYGTHNVISHDKCFVHFMFAFIQSMCTVPSMAVICTSLMMCFPSMLFICYLNVSDMVPVALVITGITFCICRISIVRFSYRTIFSATLLLLFMNFVHSVS